MSENETTTIGSDKFSLKTARTEQSLPEQNYYIFIGYGYANTDQTN